MKTNELNPATNPIDRFCAILARLPGPDRDRIVALSCMALGCRPGCDCGGISKSDFATAGRHAAPKQEWTLDHLREHVRRVVDGGVAEEMLIPGLLLFLVDHLRLVERSTCTSNAGNAARRRLAEMRVQLATPHMLRAIEADDEDIEAGIDWLEHCLPGAFKERAHMGRLANEIERAWHSSFGSEYWLAWTTKNAGCNCGKKCAKRTTEPQGQAR